MGEDTGGAQDGAVETRTEDGRDGEGRSGTVESVEGSGEHLGKAHGVGGEEDDASEIRSDNGVRHGEKDTGAELHDDVTWVGVIEKAVVDVRECGEQDLPLGAAQRRRKKRKQLWVVLKCCAYGSGECGGTRQEDMSLIRDGVWAEQTGWGGEGAHAMEEGRAGQGVGEEAGLESEGALLAFRVEVCEGDDCKG